jgi:hypothetical protein
MWRTEVTKRKPRQQHTKSLIRVTWACFDVMECRSKFGRRLRYHVRRRGGGAVHSAFPTVGVQPLQSFLPHPFNLLNHPIFPSRNEPHQPKICALHHSNSRTRRVISMAAVSPNNNDATSAARVAFIQKLLVDHLHIPTNASKPTGYDHYHSYIVSCLIED